MPKGTRLHCTAHFDNSADNLANPDPTKDVTFGDQTWEEMMFGFYTSIDPKQDLTAGGLAASRPKDGEVNGFAGEGSVTAATPARKPISNQEGRGNSQAGPSARAAFFFALGAPIALPPATTRRSLGGPCAGRHNVAGSHVINLLRDANTFFEGTLR